LSQDLKNVAREEIARGKVVGIERGERWPKARSHGALQSMLRTWLWMNAREARREFAAGVK